jgi:hypothetical protein
MVFRGRFQNGVVVLDKGAKLEEGQSVSVRVLRQRPSRVTKKKTRGLSLYERFKPFIGIAKGLPADWASQHDHYIHGTPKRK